MRLYTNLFENATSLESILEAWDEFEIGKRKKPDVQEFEYHLSDNLFSLHDELVNETLLLQLHPDKVEIRKYSEGIDFLGYVAMPQARMLRTRTKRRILRKLDQKLQSLKNESISEESFLQAFASYLGVMKHANAHNLEEKLKHEIWETIKSPKEEKIK